MLFIHIRSEAPGGVVSSKWEGSFPTSPENRGSLLGLGCGRETHVETTISFEPRTVLRVVVRERIRCFIMFQGICICVTLPIVTLKASGKNLASSCERSAGVLIRVYAHP